MDQRGEVMGAMCSMWVGGVMGAMCSCVDGRGDGHHVLVCGWEG